jgi:error-prone DNA polymerase
MSARFAELAAATNYSFLRGASHPSDMVARAIELGMAGIGIADRNSVAGVVRAHVALKEAQAEARRLWGRELDFRLVVGARLVFADGTPDIIAYPATRFGWGRLTRLLTIGNLRAGKGDCILRFGDLLAHGEDLLLIVMAGETDEFALRRLAEARPGSVWLGATLPRGGADRRRLERLAGLARRAGVPLLATNDALYAAPEQRRLHDILSCIREKVTITEAGRLLAANAERHLKGPEEMARLFRDRPEAVAAADDILSRIAFTLDQLRYEYPHEPVPEGWTPQGWLEHLVMEAAHKAHPDGLPPKLIKVLDEEFSLIRKLNYACYFLTVHDIVRFARTQDPPILCQGRGSAANSVVCYLLGITAIDPIENNLLFTRFLSEERNEPPDIDVDFEHERREEVMQYVYRRYGRHRAGIAATVIHYRSRSTVREVGKALGLTEDVTQRLASTIWGSYASAMPEQRFIEAGFDPDNPEIARLKALVDQLMEFPRHLSQHVGGFVLTEDRLDETVPIHNAAMADRTFIEWDKDDIDALGLMKVDVLALGMLTCIRKAFDLIEQHEGTAVTLATEPREDEAVYDMLCKADSIGVFQVESRAQMNMLPRLKPRCFYDLVIEVAIVRPGPIQGDMVHPYLRRRDGVEVEHYPSPSPKCGDKDELRNILGKTKGVPLFQEQAMRIALVAAKFSDAEVNELRKAMATFRRRGTIGLLEEKMVSRMVARGYDKDFAQRCFNQIKGFGEYGFPESHAASFAHLVYVSSWIKCHHPAAFAAALLNSQPMGFYAPAQIVRDAIEHAVEVRAADVNLSDWDSTLEKDNAGRPAMRLGLRQIDGLQEEEIGKLVAARASKPFRDVHELWARARVKLFTLEKLAAADAFRSVQAELGFAKTGLDRRQALWEVKALGAAEPLPLFSWSETREAAAEPFVQLPQMRLSEHVVNDYQTLRLSLKAHPMSFLRERFTARRVIACDELRGIKDGAYVSVAGVVLVRQRPGSAKGVVFMTIEDETGIANAVVWAKTLERFRKEVMASRLIVIHGRVQRHQDIIHVVSAKLEDRSDWLQILSAEAATMKAPLANADEVLRPDPGSAHPAKFPADPNANKMHPRWASHPRDARIIPKSRDFH